MLLDEGNVMEWPEGPTRGHAEFKGWYDRVTHIFFDEVHTLSKVEPRIEGDHAGANFAGRRTVVDGGVGGGAPFCSGAFNCCELMQPSFRGYSPR